MLFTAKPAFAEEAEVAVGAVVVHGVQSTRAWLIDHVLAVEAGDRVTVAAIERGARRLRDTGLFSKVTWQLLDESITPSASDVRVLHVTVEEATSLRPIFAIERGGTRTRLKLGLRQSNALGEGIDAAAWVERVDRLSSVGVTLAAPYFVPSVLYAELAADYTARERDVFGATDSVAPRYFTSRRRGAAAELGWIVSQRVRAGLRLTSAATRTAVPQPWVGDFAIPAQRVEVSVGATLRIDQLRREAHEVSGFAIDASASEPITRDASRAGEVSSVGFVRLPPRINLGARLKLGAVDAQHLGQHYFVGGLDGLRGTLDGRFHGTSYGLANVEGRVTVVNASLLRLQSVVFADAAVIGGQTVRSLGPFDAVTLGAGVRVGIPPLGSLMWRLDVGWALVDDRVLVSFGPGQLF